MIIEADVILEAERRLRQRYGVFYPFRRKVFTEAPEPTRTYWKTKKKGGGYQLKLSIVRKIR